MGDIAIKMFETNRCRIYPSGTYRAVADQSGTPGALTPEDEYDGADGGDVEWVDENADVPPYGRKDTLMREMLADRQSRRRAAQYTNFAIFPTSTP